ncbi:AraC family transcriptional regulator ligand-binding domain-containing protein [Thalassotalea sp. G20_0]|uniref:AraC family transcriptional regulator n=1 Tax=Thalassotalea sp. G20_0 TaxID=2821093 RepID=UPI001AD96C22|nr:AraC family transcriptional regulator [Thalassotalea sp. G20_0]MBO9493531.1 AraC family transcriptional regulator ligand-binding domain-containing protein [Thalassotalea sp. G20_0]
MDVANSNMEIQRQKQWLENDSRFIKAHQQPAVLIDLASSRGVEKHRLLRHTGLFYEDIITGNEIISPEQFLQLISNTRKLLKSDDISFLFGHRLFPGNYGNLTEALLCSGNLYQALKMLCCDSLTSSPLLAMHMQMDDQFCHIRFFDTCGLQENDRFVLETMMAAISQLSRWLSGNKPVWKYNISQSPPEYIEQFHVHLGENITFNAQADSIVIPKDCLFQAWPNGKATAYEVAKQRCEAGSEQNGSLFIAAVVDFLYREVRHSPSLEQTASAFCMSPATLKRKLKKHRTHFQALQDIVRKQVAVYLFNYRGYSNEQVAEWLNFSDTSNFRRAFIRWTGITPTLLKAS